MNPKPGYLLPDWPAPDNIRALSSTRDGGVSLEPYSAANLALHVGDCEAHVRENRRRLMAAASLPAEPQWLEQVHGNKVVRARDDGRILTADACYTDRRGLPCAVLTADCLPVLLCNRTGTQVAAVHAGWRSLAAGILRKTVATFPEGGGEILAWLGPAIGPARFEVGVEVLEAFFASAIDSDHTEMMGLRLYRRAAAHAFSGRSLYLGPG